MVVEGWLHRAARMRPDRVAVESPEGSRTYAELLARARAYARVIKRRDVQPRDRVAIALPPGLAFAEAFHGCLLAGVVAVPVDLRLGEAERALVCDGAALVVDETLVPRESPVPTPAATQTSSHTQTPVSVATPASTAAPALTATPASIATPLPAVSPSTEPALAEAHDLDAVAAVIHTSGTTSAPRPVELTYGNFLWSALGSAVALDLDPRERWLCALPVAHVGGLSILVRSAIYGTTAIIHPRFDTELVVEALSEERDRRGGITLISLVATTLARLLDAGLEHPPALRWALTGGGPVPEGLIARARDAGVPVATTYGLTEACSQVTTGGPPLFCTRVRIDRTTLSPGPPLGPASPLGQAPYTGGTPGTGAVPTGDAPGTGAVPGTNPDPDSTPSADEEGEILVAGPTIARASLAPDGWLHTGDLGSLDEHGHLHVTGRLADTIVSGGENVAPAEVEAVLEAHPDVLECAVLGRPDSTWGEAVSALVVLRVRDGEEAHAPHAPHHALNLEEALREHCAARLARYKVPKQFDFTSTPLPRTRSGKLLRRELA